MITPIFADSFYWIALLNDRDQGHIAALATSRVLRGAQLVTTEEVLTEVLNFFSESGAYSRELAVQLSDRLQVDRSITVIEQSHVSFLHGLELYRSRLDKGYSLTDCISMTTMRRGGITDVLTHDDHFAREGFTLLL